jgi:hypothetical protein
MVSCETLYPGEGFQLVTDLRLPLVLIALGLPAFLTKPADAVVVPDVGTVDFVSDIRTVTLAIPTGARKPYRVSWVASSRRLDVEVEGMYLPGKRTLFMNRGVVKTLRAEPMGGNRARLTFELSAPADLRTITHGPANTLSLAIYASGAPQQVVAAQKTPTSSPKPVIALRPPMPAPRITPEPILDAPGPLAVAPIKPEMTPGLPERPVVPVLDPPSLTDPLLPGSNASPEADSAPAVSKEPQVFGSRFAGGAELPLSVQETFLAGNAEIETGLTSAGSISYQHMFTSNLGMSLEGRGMRYAFRDADLIGSGFEVTRSRLDMEGNLALQGRLPLGGGFELMGRLGPAARFVNVTATVRPEETAQDAPVAPAEATEAPGPNPLVVSDYLSSPWQAYGVHTTIGAGVQLNPMFGISLTGGLNYLLAGTMGQANVSGIFPMLGLRGALETRFDFGMVGMTLGYAVNTYRYSEGEDRELSQLWHGPMLKLGISY